MDKIYYITAAIDYVNASPHIGTAFEKICTDVLARFMRAAGKSVYFQMGNDEHSANVQKRAQELGMSTLAYCDKMNQEFVSVWDSLNIQYDHFIRTTSSQHKQAVIEIFRRLHQSGDIVKGTYAGWYCVSCEAYKKEADLIEGNCPHHDTKPQWIEEENFFFALSRYQDAILEHIKLNPDFIQPPLRKNEVVNILKEGLDDISITRSSTDWGVASPFDETQICWVWFDALINYISGIGFPNDLERFQQTWPANKHIIGKDIIRQHCIVWPAMLLSAGLPLPHSIMAHGFIYIKGAKMSKSHGTAITPQDVVATFGIDSLRYYLLKEASFAKDGDFSWEKFTDRYNTDLANDLGNLLHRTITMIIKYQDGKIRRPSQEDVSELRDQLIGIAQSLPNLIETCDFASALNEIWTGIRRMNMYIEEHAPWTLFKQNKQDQLTSVLYDLAEGIRIVTTLLHPFIPDSAELMLDQLGLHVSQNPSILSLAQAQKWDVIPDQHLVHKGNPVFPKIETNNE